MDIFAHPAARRRRHAHSTDQLTLQPHLATTTARFISNPDLPRRLKLGAPLAKYDRNSFYSQGARLLLLLIGRRPLSFLAALRCCDARRAYSLNHPGGGGEEDLNHPTQTNLESEFKSRPGTPFQKTDMVKGYVDYPSLTDDEVEALEAAAAKLAV